MFQKIQPLFKSLLLLIFVDSLFASIVLLFLEIRFLIPTLAGLIILNLSFYFSVKTRLLGSLSCKKIHPNDPWRIHALLKGFKNKPSYVDFYISKAPSFFSLSYGNRMKTYIVFSESLWESLSEKEKKMLIHYHFHFIKEGWTLLLTLLHSLLFGIEKLLFIFNFPQFILRKKREQNKNILFTLLLKALGFITQKFFLQRDQEIALLENQKQILALLLWKIQSLHQVQKNPFPLSLTPLLIGNPLTSLERGCYISLQPDIKVRVKALRGSYPP